MDGGCRVARLDLLFENPDGDGLIGLKLRVYAQIYPDTSVFRLCAEVVNNGQKSRLLPATLFNANLFPEGVFRCHWLHGGQASGNQGLLESEVMTPSYRREIEDNSTRSFVPLMIFRRENGAGDGLLLEMESLGPWRWEVCRNGEGPAQVRFALGQSADIEIRPNVTAVLPVITLSVFHGDLDDMGVRLYDWQYRYLWDCTNPEYFARPRMGSWGWFFPSRNLQESFAARLAGMEMQMDEISTVGYEIL